MLVLLGSLVLKLLLPVLKYKQKLQSLAEMRNPLGIGDFFLTFIKLSLYACIGRIEYQNLHFCYFTNGGLTYDQIFSA